jgi:copper chaperone CopZ
MTMQATLKVPRIHCDGCVNTVTQAVRKLQGVQSVEASETTKVVNVEFDPAQVSEDQIRATLQLVGYPPA